MQDRVQCAEALHFQREVGEHRVAQLKPLLEAQGQVRHPQTVQHPCEALPGPHAHRHAPRLVQVLGVASAVPPLLLLVVVLLFLLFLLMVMWRVLQLMLVRLRRRW